MTTIAVNGYSFRVLVWVNRSTVFIPPKRLTATPFSMRQQKLHKLCRGRYFVHGWPNIAALTPKAYLLSFCLCFYCFYFFIFLSPPAQSRRQENQARHTKLWLQRQFTVLPWCCGKKPHFLLQSHGKAFLLFLFMCGWLCSRVVSVLDSGAEGPGFKSQP